MDTEDTDNEGDNSAAVRLFHSSVDGSVQAGLAGEAVTDSEGSFTVDGLATAAGSST